MNILYAEDHPGFRKAIADHLKSHGHNVTEVPDGYAALAALKTDKKFDAIISDGHMVSMDKTKPELSGYKLLNMPETKSITTKILLSSNADIYIAAAKENGEDNNIDFLVKHDDHVKQKLDNYLNKIPVAGTGQSNAPSKILPAKSPRL